MSGTLFLVATPIGNVEDITYRAVRVLNEVDLIAAEDTRTSKKLLDRYKIDTSMTSYHEHNKIEKANKLIDKLKEGMDIALITDAGTPGISDPGEELVRMCYNNEIEVIAIPGASAAVTAITVSGQPCRRFAFEAFLPKDKKYRQHVLDELSQETRTIIIYESPHHLKATFNELANVLGQDRSLTITRELTKCHEEKVRTTLGEAISFYTDNEPRGEYVLVIAGKSRREQEEEARGRWEDVSLEDHMQIYLDKGMDKKEAMKAVASDRGVSKRDVYKELINEKN